ATNRDPAVEVQKGTFRQDLFFRLNGMTITVPPLRARPGEIEPLARVFAARAAASMGRPEPARSRGALAELARYPWPGNVRELRNVMERAVVLAPGANILPEHLLLEQVKAAAPSRSAAADEATVAGPRALQQELSA